MNDPVVTLAHCRRLNYCARGMRIFCERHELDWQQFRKHGLPASLIEGTGDAMATAAAQLARQEEQEG